jgi:hypothetical protein
LQRAHRGTHHRKRARDQRGVDRNEHHSNRIL